MGRLSDQPAAHGPAPAVPHLPTLRITGRQVHAGLPPGACQSGGTVVARCDGRDVRLDSWAPAQGYGVADVDRGPNHRVEITFKGSGSKIEVTLRCEGGQPVESWKLED